MFRLLLRIFPPRVAAWVAGVLYGLLILLIVLLITVPAGEFRYLNL
jgi:hypothetical protein